MSDCDGEDSFRGSTLMTDLGVIERVGTVYSAEATSNRAVEIAYPGISTWKITAIGRTAHPTEPERGINAIAKMARLVLAVEEGRLKLPSGDSRWFEPRVTTNAIRTLPGGGWAIPGRCDAVLSVLSPPGTTLAGVRGAIESLLRELEADDGEARFESKILPMGAGRLWLRPGEVDPEHEGVKALEAAVREVTGRRRSYASSTAGGWMPRSSCALTSAASASRRPSRSAPATSSRRTRSTSTSRSRRWRGPRRSTCARRAHWSAEVAAHGEHMSREPFGSRTARDVSGED